jgi:hypothetical protein
VISMIGALRSNTWGAARGEGGSIIAAALVHDANATKAPTANLDGCSRRQHTHCGLFLALVDAPIGNLYTFSGKSKPNRAAETFTSRPNVLRCLCTHRICYPSNTGN